MLQENSEMELPIDTPESKRVAALAVGSWLVALAIFPGGGLLWQMGAIAQFGNWIVGNVLAKLQLSGLFV